MDTANQPVLRDESIFPDEKVLKGIFGDTFTAYQGLLKLFDENGLDYGWRYYKDVRAWLCKVQKKSKTIVWMGARQGNARATIYLPEVYIEKLYALDISEERKEIIRSISNTGKSKACSFEIKSTDVLEDFSKVMQLKMSLK